MTEFVQKMDDFVPKITEFSKKKLPNSQKIKNFQNFKKIKNHQILKKIGQIVLFELFRFRV